MKWWKTILPLRISNYDSWPKRPPNAFKLGGVSIVLIMIILYCMRHPFEMVQNKERKSMDSDVYLP